MSTPDVAAPDEPVVDDIPKETRDDFLVLIGMLLVIAVPAAITLHAIKTPRLPLPVPPVTTDNPSPHGYTWSLLLFVFPCIALGWWVLAMHRGIPEKRAFWTTIGLMGPLWCLLDVFFGLTFFRFPNLGASIGTFPGYMFGRGWVNTIPVEEIGFYLLGFIAMLLVYIWGDEYLLRAYRRPRPTTPDAYCDLIAFHRPSVFVGAVLFALAWAYKAFGPHPYHKGFPGYFLFMLLATILPTILCFRIARPFINWRALMLTVFFILFLSIFWEATVGVPYQWWDYNRDQMVGIFIGAFTGLPLEAVLLWAFSAWAVVIIYETIHIVQMIGRREALRLLLNPRKAGVTAAAERTATRTYT